jgi:hypothetical protein
LCGWGLFLIYIWLALLLFLIEVNLLVAAPCGFVHRLLGFRPYTSVSILSWFIKTLACVAKNALS